MKISNNLILLDYECKLRASKRDFKKRFRLIEGEEREVEESKVASLGNGEAKWRLSRRVSRRCGRRWERSVQVRSMGSVWEPLP